jgi:hypothetical protein
MPGPDNTQGQGRPNGTSGNNGGNGNFARPPVNQPSPQPQRTDVASSAGSPIPDPASPPDAPLPAVLTSRKSAGPSIFVVKHDVLGLVPAPKEKGAHVRREQLGDDANIHRLIDLGAIEPLIVVTEPVYAE